MAESPTASLSGNEVFMQHPTDTNEGVFLRFTRSFWPWLLTRPLKAYRVSPRLSVAIIPGSAESSIILLWPDLELGGISSTELQQAINCAKHQGVLSQHSSSTIPLPVERGKYFKGLYSLTTTIHGDKYHILYPTTFPVSESSTYGHIGFLDNKSIPADIGNDIQMMSDDHRVIWHRNAPWSAEYCVIFRDRQPPVQITPRHFLVLSPRTFDPVVIEARK